MVSRKQKTVMLKAHLAITHTATSDFYRIMHHEPDTDIAKVLEIIYSVSFHDKPFKLLDEAVEILKKKLTTQNNCYTKLITHKETYANFTS